MEINKVTIANKFELIDQYFTPHIISSLNGQHVKIAKIKGEFIWHSHPNEDELFLVIKGQFDMELRDKTIRLNPGDMITIPRGIEHRPIAVNECHILMFEPIGTLNTGDQEGEMTRRELEEI